MTISTTMVGGTSHLMVVCMVVRSRPDVSLVVGREGGAVTDDSDGRGSRDPPAQPRFHEEAWSPSSSPGGSEEWGRA